MKGGLVLVMEGLVFFNLALIGFLPGLDWAKCSFGDFYSKPTRALKDRVIMQGV
jgi:hypothetical protein